MTFLSDAPLAQLDRALDFGSSGRGFESLRARQQIRSGYPYWGARIFFPNWNLNTLLQNLNQKYKLPVNLIYMPQIPGFFGEGVHGLAGVSPHLIPFAFPVFPGKPLLNLGI